MKVQRLGFCFFIFLVFDGIGEILVLSLGPDLGICSGPAATPAGILGRVRSDIQFVEEDHSARRDAGDVYGNGDGDSGRVVGPSALVSLGFGDWRNDELDGSILHSDEGIRLLEVIAGGKDGNESGCGEREEERAARGPRFAASKLPDWRKEQRTKGKKTLESL